MPGPTHRESRTPLYQVWQAMKRRCYNPNAAFYADYGGRGIMVCDTWRSSYESFREWALANGYRSGLDIDRIDNDGHYSPDNCRFVTRRTNTLNRRSNVRLSAFGEIKTAMEWSEDPRCPVAYSTLLRRVRKGTWADEEAITTPVMTGQRPGRHGNQWSRKQ